MGRYYSGDIEGKFWFAVQSSDAADRFGVTGVKPESLYYYFDEEDLEEVQAENKRIEEFIGLENIAKIKDFFEKVNGYNDQILEEHGMTSIWSEFKSDYADYLLGKQIEKCIIENGQCEFTAET